MKSAKRLNRKLVKSCLTKKRRQVGRGYKNYTVNYEINSQSMDIDITINIPDDDNEATITSEDNQDLIKEKRLPTKAQFVAYATNFLPNGRFTSTAGTGLFITKEPDSTALTFFKLHNKKVTIINPDGLNINVSDISMPF